MYKILIVDDEDIVRKGIRKKLDWKSLGFEVIGEAENGREALAIAQEQWPDVILTDIKMPHMDGIELTKIINERMPDTQMIILTGYEEFEYAQKSVKLGVLDYVLKPISPKELTAVIVKIKNILDRKENSEKEIEALKKQVKMSMPILRDRFLNDLISMPMEVNEIADKMKFHAVDLPGKRFCCCVVELDDYRIITENYTENEKQLLKFTLLNTINKITVKYENIITFIAGYNYITLLFGVSLDSLSVISAQISDTCEELLNATEQSMNRTISIGVGRLYDSADKLRLSFKEACDALGYKFLLGKKNIIFASDVLCEQRPYNEYPFEIEQQLLSAVRLGNPDEIDVKLNDFSGAVLQYSNISRDYIQLIYNQLLNAVLKMIQEIGVDIKEIYSDGYRPHYEISKIDTLEDTSNWMKEFLNSVSLYITSERDHYYKLMVEKARRYMEQNFSDSDISLSDVSSFVNVSSCYFSVIFKKEIGETFQEYMIKLRINRAKELLRTTDKKSYEIAEMIGYSDPHYFGVSFKKYVGVTPIEYRELKKAAASGESGRT